MMAESKCPSCNANVLPTDHFCGECGADLTLSVKKPAAARTMVGISASAAAPAAQVPFVLQPTVPPPPQKKPAAQATLLGVPPAVLEQGHSVQAPGKATVRGVAPPSEGHLLDGSEPPGAAQSPRAQAVAAAGPARKDTPKRTLLGGMVAAVRGKSSGGAKRAIPAISDRTILGMQSALPGAQEDAASGADPYDDDAVTAIEAPLASKLRRSGLVVGGLLLAASAVWLFSGSDDGVGARVVQGPSGDELEISVPDAPDGTKLRFAGKEAPVKSGKARFPLAADTLHLGSNALGVSVVEADGSAVESSLSLEVDYRARFELGSLAELSPSATFVLDVLPGSGVKVDGKPLKIDGKGHGQQALPLSPGAATARELVVRFRVEPPEKAAIDAELKAQLPAASLALESPSEDLITEAKQTLVAGSVGNDTHVTVAGEEATVKEGHFERTVELPMGETEVAVVARAAGKAPRLASLRVKRVPSLAVAAASFTPDSSISYGVLAKDPSALRGKSVAFEGRIYNVELHAGRTVLQILVGDCARSERCPLWVELGERASFAKDASVRVLGTVSGEQQFRSKQGAVQSVPSVHGSFVLRTTGK